MPFFISAQEDTTNFEGVTILGTHQKIENKTTIDREEIDILAPVDLGALLQYVNGLSIKNYGGIGGMKTLSHRGLGGEHTQLFIDGMTINNPQNGQTNLANIQLNNVEEVGLNHQNSKNLLPVSGLIKGSSVQITTFDQQFTSDPFALRSAIKMGSFGEKEASLSIKKAGKKGFISLSTKFRDYRGNYPYRLSFGDEIKEFKRQNNALQDYHLSLGGGFKWRTKKTAQTLKLYSRFTSIDQELPGAVILYNNSAKETLATQNFRSGIQYKLISKRFAVKTFAQYTRQFLHYFDPDYLNAQGFLSNQYTSHSVKGGFHARYKWKDFTLRVGNDVSYAYLLSSRNLDQPSRMTNTAMARLKYESTYFYVEGSLFSQVFKDENSGKDHRSTYHKIQPQLSVFSSDKLLKDIQLYAWYKPSSRAPSFNELYFSQVGNVDLVPEESSQINVGAHYIKTIKRFNIHINANLFKNTVREKILALPTKNLFVWSIQNIGKVDVLGGDMKITTGLKCRAFRRTGRENWHIKWQVGASYQHVRDVSDPDSPTYKDQIAYTPKLTGNTVFSLSYKKIGVHLTGLYIGERYSLNENIKSNRLDPYFLTNLSASYSLPIAEKHQLSIRAGVKNIADVSYNYIRYFVMPGRNYFIKISYAFN